MVILEQEAEEEDTADIQAAPLLRTPPVSMGAVLTTPVLLPGPLHRQPEPRTKT